MNDPVMSRPGAARRTASGIGNTTGTRSRRRRAAGAAALVLTVAAAAQQAAIAVGFGGRLPGWQPWPLLLPAAPAWLASRFPPAGPAARTRWRPATTCGLRRVPAVVLLLGILALAVCVWAWFQDKEPHLGHEEAVYGNKARSWLDDGTPAAGWGIYRPPGLPVLGRMALAVHDDVGALRTVALLLTLFTLVTVYVTASRWLSPHRAVLIVLLLLGGIGFMRRIPEFLNDIGATGLLLVIVYLITHAQENASSRALLVLPFVVLLAFYFRYGVVGSLLAVFAAALFAYGPRAWAAHHRHLTVAGAVLGLGLVPHLVHAHAVTDSPLGIVLSATSQANRRFIGDGLLYYLAVFPYRLAGDLGALVMAAGVAAFAGSARRLWRAARHPAPVPRPIDDPAERRTVFLGASALLVFVVLGLATDGEPRFVYLSVVLLLVLGVGKLPDLAGGRARQVMAVVGLLGLLTVFGTAQVTAYGAMPAPDRLSDSTIPVARQLRAAEPCLLVTGYEPEMGWYSGCDAVTYAQYWTMAPPAGTRISLVTFERGRLQPDAAGLRRLTEGHRVVVTRIPTRGSAGDATVYTLQ